MVTGYWSVDTLFRQVSIDHYMDVQLSKGRYKPSWSTLAPLSYARLHRAYAPTGHNHQQKINL